MEDRQIIALFFAREEQAIYELDRKYGKNCRALSYHIVNNREDAEECVNDAYLGMWRAVPPTRPDPLLPYLAKIVRNISLNCYRKATANKRGGGYDAALREMEQWLADRRTIEEELDAKELARMIEAFLDTLSAENRVIFIRRYWFADHYQEIAARVGLPEKTVSVRLHRMRNKLKVYLRRKGMLV